MPCNDLTARGREICIVQIQILYSPMWLLERTKVQRSMHNGKGSTEIYITEYKTYNVYSTEHICNNGSYYDNRYHIL